MKRGAPLKTRARLARRTPLKSSGCFGLATRSRSGPAAGASVNPSWNTRGLAGGGALTKSPLKRKKPMRRKPPRRLERDAPEAGYTHWLHYQVCRAAGVVPHDCSHRTQAAHLRDHTGLSRKEPAERQTTLCDVVHQEFDQRRGYFAGWSNEARLEWFLARVAESRAEWLLLPPAERDSWLAAAHRWAGRVAG